MYDALVITGTSGAGKTTVANALTEGKARFELVRAVTTRKRRDDDKENQYEYVGGDQFRELRGQDELFIETTYRGQYYGIRWNAIEKVREAGSTPVLVVTPESG